MLLRFVGVMKLILLCPFSIQGRETYLGDVVEKKTTTLACIHSFEDQFLSNFGIMIKTTNLYILISVWMTLTFIYGHSCMRNQKL